MLNRCILMGRLCADPEMKHTASGVPCCHFRIAVNRKKQKDGTREADFINCTAWRQTAEFICRYFSKGNMIIIEGQLRNNDYTDNNGVKHYSMDVLVDSASFAEPKNAGADQSQQQPYEPQQQPYGQYAPPYGAAQQQAPPPQSYQAPLQQYQQQYQAPPQQYQQPYQPPHYDAVPPPNGNPYHP